MYKSLLCLKHVLNSNFTLTKTMTGDEPGGAEENYSTHHYDWRESICNIYKRKKNSKVG